jgi:ubiquinone/menaquinone biosynthesis C-methylase UbiE
VIVRPYTRKDIVSLLNEIYDVCPREWTLKEGALAFPGYISYVGDIVRSARSLNETHLERRFLDVGMSMGIVACAASKLGFLAHGVDNLKNHEHRYLSPIRQRFGVIYADYDASFDCLPFDDEYFDIINCNDVIEHLHTSPQRMLTEMRRVLKKGGFLLITTPNLAALHNRIMLLFGGTVHHSIEDWFHNPIWRRTTFTGHIREYTPRELRYMLRESGFEDVCVTTRYILPGSATNTGADAAELDFTGSFSYLKDAPYYDRKFAVRSLRDLALLAFFVITCAMPDARLELVATARK